MEETRKGEWREGGRPIEREEEGPGGRYRRRPMTNRQSVSQSVRARSAGFI